MKNLRKLILILVGALFIVLACKKKKGEEITPPCNNPVDTLTCIEKKIEQLKAYCLDSVYQCLHNDTIVYLFIDQASCSEAAKNVYNETCTYICRVSGGASGNGTCPNFLDEITDKKLIWSR